MHVLISMLIAGCNCTWHHIRLLLKVSKYRKQILKFSLEPKNERFFSVFLPWLHTHSGRKYFVRFLVQMKTLKFAFDIYWPLKVAKSQEIFSFNLQKDAQNHCPVNFSKYVRNKKFLTYNLFTIASFRIRVPSTLFCS